MISTRRGWLCFLATIIVAVAISGSKAESRLPWIQCQQGDHAEYVRTIQYLLRSRGFKVKADSTFDTQTKNAVRHFQRTKKLVANGIVGEKTWEALIVPVRRGNKGDAVRAAQNILTFIGYKVPVDGEFGSQTEAAVKGFQHDIFLKNDGIVGPVTWNTMLNQGMFGPD